jgi:hypothetical protein
MKLPTPNTHPQPLELRKQAKKIKIIKQDELGHHYIA